MKQINTLCQVYKSEFRRSEHSPVTPHQQFGLFKAKIVPQSNFLHYFFFRFVLPHFIIYVLHRTFQKREIPSTGQRFYKQKTYRSNSLYLTHSTKP